MLRWANNIRQRERNNGNRDIQARRRFNAALAALRSRSRPYRSPDPQRPPLDPCARHNINRCPGECSVVTLGQQTACRDKCTFHRAGPNMAWVPVPRMHCRDPCDWVDRGNWGYCASVYNMDSDVESDDDE